MCQVVEGKQEQGVESWMMSECNQLFQKWLVDLDQEEKEIWLWNALVAMKKIEKRRTS